MTPFTFAVIADSHFHPPGVPEQAAWDEDRLFNERNAHVVRMLQQAKPAFVIHVGDVPHPVPGLAAHDDALDVAQALYGQLPCPFYVVPGNHDIGDKPKPTTPVPADPAHRVAFRKRWGPLWQRFDHEGCAMLLLDAPVMNTGSEEEHAQWAWLDDQVAALQGRRWFAFVHYPPFLLSPDEPEHYDNLGEPARSRLLGLLQGAEATFCGHVHHFFWHVAQRHWLLPSTAFVRPGFSEMSAIGPGRAFGRDDTHKLGLAFVHVDEAGSQVEIVRSHGHATAAPLQSGRRAAPVHRLGVTLRHRWDRTFDIPADGLDPFGRKQARDDLVLLSLLEAGVRRLRLPVADHRCTLTQERLAALATEGFTARFFGTERPPELPDAVFEHITPRAHPAEGGSWAPVGRGTLRDGERFSHFPTLGFLPEEERPPHGVVRVPADRSVWSSSVTGTCLVELPRAAENRRFDDDVAVACRVAEALVTALAFPQRELYLDGWVDHDRGYYPRSLLLDRAGEPRLAHRVLVHLNRLLPREGDVRRHEEPDVAVFVTTGGAVWIPARGVRMPAGIDLGLGVMRPAETAAVPRWVSAG